MISTIHQSTLDELNRIYAEFLENGFVVMREAPWSNKERREKRRIISATNTLRAHFRKVAAELRRPFLWVEVVEGLTEDGTEHFEAKVDIKHTKRMEPIASPLHLDPNVPLGGRWSHQRSQPYVKDFRKSVCSFYFNGPEGKKRLEKWLKLCRTHPEARKALKLPTLITP